MATARMLLRIASVVLFCWRVGATCQSSVDDSNTEVTFAGRRFKVLPAASVSGYATGNTQSWHEPPSANKPAHRLYRRNLVLDVD